MIRYVLIAVIAAFGALTALAIEQHGYLGIFAYSFANSAGWQILADLVISCTLAMVWMVADARKTGRKVWPYIVLTLAAGSFGPLLYLSLKDWSARAA